MKGGVGKTTLATNVAYCLVQHEKKKVLVIDIDPQFNATQCFFSGDQFVDYMQKGGNTILDLFEGDVVKVSTVEGADTKKAKQFIDITPQKIKDNLYILPGNLNLYKIEISAGSGKESRLKKYLDEIDKQYHFDYVIVDTPPTPSIWMTSALLASQFYIIPVKPDPLSYTGISLLQNIIAQKKEDLDLEIKCLGIVLSMVETNTVVYRKCLDTINGNKFWKPLLFQSNLSKRTDIPKYQLNQKLILDLDLSDIKLKITQIVSEMIKRIESYENK